MVLIECQAFTTLLKIRSHVNLNAFSIGSESAERIKVLSKGFCTNSMASLKWLNEVKIQVEPELAYFSQV